MTMEDFKYKPEWGVDLDTVRLIRRLHFYNGYSVNKLFNLFPEVTHSHLTIIVNGVPRATSSKDPKKEGTVHFGSKRSAYYATEDEMLNKPTYNYEDVVQEGVFEHKKIYPKAFFYIEPILANALVSNSVYLDV